MTIAEQLLQQGFGVTITIYPNPYDYFGHALTVWDYEYENGEKIGMWVTDSDDPAWGYTTPTLQLLTIEQVEDTQTWQIIGGKYDGWHIRGFQALKARDLIVHWTFNESEGNIAKDVSGSGYDGTIIGAIHVPGIDGNALDFTGDGNEVVAPGNFDEYILNHFTVMLWAKIESAKPDNYLFHVVDDQPGIRIDDNNSVRFVYRPNSSSEPFPLDSTAENWSEPIESQEWTHIAITWNGSTYEGYINGNQVVEIPLPYFISGGEVRIGKDSFTAHPERSFDGLIDDVRIYNRALTKDEIWERFAEFDDTTHYIITVKQSEQGSISPAGENGQIMAAKGSDQTFTITPAAGYYFGKLLLDGKPTYHYAQAADDK